MNYFNEAGSPVGDSPARVTGHLRRKYRRPALEKLGDLRTMTLGGSPGTGDSGGSSLVTFPPGVHGSSPGFPDIPDEFKLPDDPYIPPF